MEKCLKKGLINIKLKAIFFTVIVLISFTATRLAYASSKNGPTNIVCSEKRYRSVMIYLGDDLGSMAEKYISPEYASVNAFTREVMSINHLNADTHLIPGNYIIIPYFISDKTRK